MKNKLLKSFVSRLILFLTLLCISSNTVIAQNVLNNDKIRIGNGSENSINELGNMQQPFYYNQSQSAWRKLTFSSYPLDNAFATGGDGSSEWNVNGTLVENPALTNQVIDYSQYVITGTGTGYGKVISTGTVIIGDATLQVEYTYTLGQNTSYIQTKCKVTNIGTTTATNVRTWLGTRDDYVGDNDGPVKTRGNLADGEFATVSSTSVQAKALKIESGVEGVLFYTNHPGAYTSINWCCSFINAINTDPLNSLVTEWSDGSYAMYVRFNDLAVGASEEFSLYYAAGEVADLEEIINEVAQASGAVNNITTNSAVFTSSSQTATTGYYIVVPQGAAVPTAVQIAAGLTYDSVSIINSGTAAMAANVSVAYNLTGLLPSTSYTLHFVTFNGTAYSTVYSANFTTLAPLTALISSSVNVACSGGTTGAATVTPSGATTPYTYLWSNGATTATATGLAAGTYNVTVTDANNLTATQSVTITQPTATLAASKNSVNLYCNGGTTGVASVSVSGGTSPYTYLWSNGATSATATGLAAGAYSVTITDANGCTLTENFTITEPTALVATQSQVNVLCNGESNASATVTATGGEAGYTYLWSNGATTATATGLSAGAYSVVITDANGCTLTKNFTITQPTALVATQSQVNVLCNGGSNGSATVTATGGEATYTYLWSNGATTATVTGLAAGTYSVIVTDANGCTITKNFTITQPTALVATQSQVNVSCNGGSNASATVIATGGEAAYTYLWSNGATTATTTGLAAGAYSVTITDANGCTITKNFTVTQPAVLAATQSQVNVSCNGGSNASATVIATGGEAPYTYLWSNGATTATATGLAAGTYSVIITDANGCTITKNFTITQPTALVATQSQVNVSCNGGSNASATVTATGGTGAYTYAWSPSGGTAATATGLTAGTYSVVVTDANGCTITKNFTLTQPTALVATQSQVNVSCNGGSNASATVVTTGGEAGYTYSWSPSGGTAATATGLAAGAYSVTITDANGCTLTKNFTITQPTALVATQSQVNVSCNGGTNASATVIATGGEGGYTYAWSPSGGTAATATGLTAGTYTVTITDANGCTVIKNFTITQPTALVATQSQVNVSCNGGANASATVTATGGTGAYTYAWSPSGGTAATATGLSAGTYSVIITDVNGCTITKNFTITQPTALVATQSQVNVSCNGGSNASATVVATGGTGAYTYLWSNGATTATVTGLTAGTYSVVITDANGCTITKNFTITQPAALVATATQTTTATCLESTDGGATATVTGGTMPYAYLWDNGVTTATVTNLSVGTHTVTVTDAQSCTITATVVIGFNDTIAPVPALATLPNITAECVITAADVPVPTATDNCVGTVTVSHNASFPTTAQGTTVITWTYTDVNGNTTTQAQNVIIDDVTAPVPLITNLPTISMQCDVLATDIPVPTANDNCIGAITATTTDPLVYTDLGTHTITWTYNDGNGNTTTQTQSVTVTESAISAVTFTDVTYIYNTEAQEINVDNLPAGASVNYTISPNTGLSNAAVNTGIYTVTATVTPAADAPNCDPIVLTATITINKAQQQIIFDALPLKHLESDPDFQLTAYATSGLPVSYTYTHTAATPPAVVNSTGWVDMRTSGLVRITAHQEGNANYLPAEVVTQPLQINSKDSTLHAINIDGTTTTAPQGDIYYLMVCDNTANAVTVTLSTEANATADLGHEFTINTPRPGIYHQAVTVTSQDGTTTATYNITVERMFPFFDIAVQKFDNVLMANNNPETNGGYSFVAYQWIKNGRIISTKQYFSEGPTTNELLDPTAEYQLKVTTVEGDVLQTCISQITLEHNYSLSVTPNPARAGNMITVTVDFPSAEMDNMQIEIFDLNGRRVHAAHTSQRITEVQLPNTIQQATYIVKCTTPNHQKSFKIIVSE